MSVTDICWTIAEFTVVSVTVKMGFMDAESKRREDPRLSNDGTAGVGQGRTQRTRRALGLAALDLFEDRGVEEVTAADIAERAGVTERTFFRHFRSKEDAALLIHQRFDAALIGGLHTSPQATPWETLRTVYRSVLESFDDRESALAGEMLRVQALASKSPPLRLASLRRDDERAEELVGQLMPPGDPTCDDELNVRMAVEVTGAAVRVAFNSWADGDGTTGLSSCFDRCLDVLTH